MRNVLAAIIFAVMAPTMVSAQTTTAESRAVATFAGGCFWCMAADFDKVAGVVSTISGYTGGGETSPSYQLVSSGRTSHAEAVKVIFDPSKVSYQMLLDTYWRNIDPLAKDRQFCDIGRQYRTAIFYHNEEQKRLAESSKTAVEAQLKKRVHTEIVPAGKFYAAESYHQGYHLKNPIKYKFYRRNCGRDQRLEELWGRQRNEM